MVKSRRKSSTRKVCFWVKKRRSTRKSTRRRKSVRRLSPQPNTFRRLREEELMALNSAFPNKPRGSLSLVRRPLTPSQRLFLQNYNTNNYDDMPLNQRLRLRADNIPRASGASMTGSIIRSNTIIPRPAVPPMSLPVYGPRNFNEDDDDSSLGSSSTSLADFIDLK